MIQLKITLPKDSEIGEVRKIRVEFKTINQNTSGISMGTGMTVAFNVVTTKESKKTSSKWIIVVSLIAIAIALFLVFKRKRKTSKA